MPISKNLILLVGRHPWRLSVSQPDAAAPPVVIDPSGLVLSGFLATAATKQAANTSQWQAFIASLEAQLLITYCNAGSYQGSDWPWAINYALGYRSLLATNQAKAYDYADKAIQALIMWLTNWERLPSNNQYFGLGDGTTTTFALPFGSINAPTFTLYRIASTTTAITRGSGTLDIFTSYTKPIAVGNTPGASDYIQGIDWDRDYYSANNIDWSLGSNAGVHKPATGATYYIKLASFLGGATSSPGYGYSLDATAGSITFTTAPAADMALFFSAVSLGARSTDFSTLKYRQSSRGDGGYPSALVDNGYASRFVGHIAIALDWLWDYPGFSSTLKTQCMTLLNRWAAAIPNNLTGGPGYNYLVPTSNYACGHYWFRLMSALVLSKTDRDPTNGGPLLTNMTAPTTGYRDSVLIPVTFASPATGGVIASYSGGFWAEGWDYAQPSIQSILICGAALEQAGVITAATPERNWTTKAIKNLLHCQPTLTTITDIGDDYAYPMPFPDSRTTGILAAMCPDSTVGSWATSRSNTLPGVTDWLDVCIRDPAAPATTSWTTTLPLADLSEGTGLLNARGDWSYNSVWLEFICGNPVGADHQMEAMGHLQAQRGADDLIVNSMAPVLTHDDGAGHNHYKAQYANLVMISTGAAYGSTGDMTYSGIAQCSTTFGNPGCVSWMDSQSSYVYTVGNTKAAWSNGADPGGGGPLSVSWRSVLMLRIPGRPHDAYVLTFDRLTSKQAAYTKQLRWHFWPGGPTLVGSGSGATFSLTRGSSSLAGAIWSNSAITVATDSFVIPGRNVSTTMHRVTADPVATQAAITYLSAFQLADIAATVDPMAYLASGDGQLVGCTIAGNVALFGAAGNPTLPVSYAITSASGASIAHHIADAVPGRSYSVQVDGTEIGPIVATTPTSSFPGQAPASGLLRFLTTGTGSSQTITIA